MKRRGPGPLLERLVQHGREAHPALRELFAHHWQRPVVVFRVQALAHPAMVVNEGLLAREVVGDSLRLIERLLGPIGRRAL